VQERHSAKIDPDQDDVTVRQGELFERSEGVLWRLLLDHFSSERANRGERNQWVASPLPCSAIHHGRRYRAHVAVRLGVAIDAGFAGDTDDYGVESPCVVKTPGGYLMAYAGFDGDVTRLHMACRRSEAMNTGYVGSLSTAHVKERAPHVLGVLSSYPGSRDGASGHAARVLTASSV
jgi:hypothetical protein